MATLHINATLQDGDGTFAVTGDLTITPTASTPATPDAPATDPGMPVDAPADVPVEDPATTPATDPASAPATTDPATDVPADVPAEQPAAEQPSSGWSGRVLRRDDDQQDPDPEVSAWQQRLTDRGFTVGSVDGFFGPLTEDGVRRFQQSCGIAMTGEIDEQTFNVAA